MYKISKSPKETEKIAKEFLKQTTNSKQQTATVVALFGELGAGKTNFTQAVGKHLGVKRKINSPTFVIMKIYKLETRNYKLMYHIDAYRLKNEKELLHLGWEEIIADPKHLILIEWPERVIKILPKKHHKIEITHTPKGYRKFLIKK